MADNPTETEIKTPPALDYEETPIINPDSVPAGKYARDVLTTARLWGDLEDRMVFTQNVRQALDYVARGEVDAAFDWLETAYRLRDGTLFWLPGAPGLDPLHADARFVDLVRRVGVVPVSTTPDRRRLRRSV